MHRKNEFENWYQTSLLQGSNSITVKIDVSVITLDLLHTDHDALGWVTSSSDHSQKAETNDPVRVWNCLPASITNLSSFPLFKNKVIEFLLK